MHFCPIYQNETRSRRNREIIRSALSESQFMEAQKKGRTMSLEQALALASES